MGSLLGLRQRPACPQGVLDLVDLLAPQHRIGLVQGGGSKGCVAD
jgi:hypothetical protein